MGAVIVTVVRNELDILEAFVRYHAELVDLLVVADHRSIDGSLELLLELQAEGLPLEVRSLTAPALRQGRTTTMLVRDVARRIGADHVLPLDADEFLTSDRPELVPELIRRLPPGQLTRLALRNAIPTRDDDPAERNPVARIVNRRAAEGKVGGKRTKLVVPRAIGVRDGWALTNGNHRLIGPAGEDELVSLRHGELFLAHYPVRSVEQVSWRLIAWFATTISKTDGKRALHGPPRRLFSQLVSGASLDPEWLTQVALRYHDETGSENDALERRALEPCPSLRYPNERQMSLLGVLGDAFDSIDEALAEGST
jgi:hypothetical protein